jgi:hypothetical protein
MTPRKHFEGFSEHINPGVTSRLRDELRLHERTSFGTSAEFEVRHSNYAVRTSRVESLPPFDKKAFERPMPSVEEFLFHPDFLGAELAPPDEPSIGLFDVWLPHLKFVLNPRNHISKVFVQAAVGSGKTTAAVCAALYHVCLLMCLKNPQRYFGLTASTRIVILIASVTKNLASNVTFDRLRSMMLNSPFFKNVLRHTPTADQIVLPKNVFVEVGSQPRHALGSAIFFALIDEGNFGARSTPQEPEHEGQILELYARTLQRIESRFRQSDGYAAGQIFVISSKRAENDALARLVEDENGLKTPTTLVIEHSLWQAQASIRGKSTGRYSGKIFRMIVGDQFNTPRILHEGEMPPVGLDTIEIPTELREPFERDPVAALRDIANIAAASTTKLIRIRERLERCVDVRIPLFFDQETVHLDFHSQDELYDHMNQTRFQQYLSGSQATGGYRLHIDTALRIDSLAIALSHSCGPIPMETTDLTGAKMVEQKMLYTTDFAIRIRPVPGKDIPLFKIVRFVLWLRDCMSINLDSVSTDNYQSVAIIQLLEVQGFATKILSVDRNDEPYLNLRELVYGERLALPSYPPLLSELVQLDHFPGDRTIDHPYGGTKDLSDAVCGSLWSFAQAAVGSKASSLLPTYVSPKVIDKEFRRRQRKDEIDEWRWLWEDGSVDRSKDQ